MKNFILLPLLLLSLQAIGLDASVGFARFKGIDAAPDYIELNFFIVGHTTSYKAVEAIAPALEKYQGAVQILVLFKQGDKIVKYDKYDLKSPLVDSLSAFKPDFLDQRRYPLDTGNYLVEIKLTDLSNEENSRSFKAPFRMAFSEDKVEVSDLLILKNFESDSTKGPFRRNGFFMEPMPFNFCRHHVKTLYFYCEIYNTDIVLADDYLFRYYIEEQAHEKKVVHYIANKRHKAQKSKNLIVPADISKLPSGNYALVVEIRNRQNELVSTRRVKFDRSNPYLNLEMEAYKEMDIKETFTADLSEGVLNYSLLAILPRLDDNYVPTIQKIIKSEQAAPKRSFLFSYFAGINRHNPKEAYEQYMTLAKLIDKEYAVGFSKGFEADRGYYYLKYGKPNRMIPVENDPNAPPYEIWEYDDFSQVQSQVAFVFYNPSLVPNDFVLLHSNAKGEINDPNWKRKLYRHSPQKGGNYIDGENPREMRGNDPGFDIFDNRF